MPGIEPIVKHFIVASVVIDVVAEIVDFDAMASDVDSFVMLALNSSILLTSLVVIFLVGDMKH